MHGIIYLFVAGISGTIQDQGLALSTNTLTVPSVLNTFPI
jgi:hypothetical protein